MNAKYTKRKITAHFAPETKFDVTPTAAAPFRALIETELEKLQTRLLRELLLRTSDPELILLFRHAVNEAAGLAVSTGFPLLLLPMLVEEKAATARHYAERQAGILKRSAAMTEVAA